MKFFNTAGPCVEAMHYMLPPEERLPQAREFIARQQYFAVHAPRQTGKTTTLRQLAHDLTAEGTHAALYISCEGTTPLIDKDPTAETALMRNIAAESLKRLPEELRPPDWPDRTSGTQIARGLHAWATNCPRPIVLILDEIDSLVGNNLRGVLRQLREHYPSRPDGFPASVILCGLRDVRDYQLSSGVHPARLGTSSPFNINVKSLRLRNFTEPEVRALYAQHTAATGQVFTDEALTSVFAQGQGQPWLTNAIGAALMDDLVRDRSVEITADHVAQAREQLIKERATHLDSLVARLHEPRVKNVIEPAVAGSLGSEYPEFHDDLLYVQDLGLVALDKPIRIANPIYQEVVARVLTTQAEGGIHLEPRSFVAPDGRLDFAKILREFVLWWNEHGAWMAARSTYHEAAAQLVLMAYLQRVVNGGGQIARESAVGRGRVDLRISWPYAGPNGTKLVQQEVVELKVWTPQSPEDPLEKGLTQLDGYLDQLALDHGTLVIFDRRPEAPPVAERTVLSETKTPSGRQVRLLRA